MLHPPHHNACGSQNFAGVSHGRFFFCSAMPPKPKSSVRYIFILSAMRSGSTLMQHIAGQQSHVLSAGETKIEYTLPDHLSILRQYLFTYQEVPPENQSSSQWTFLEKCVHRRYLPAINPIDLPETRFLFIIRHPHPALSSLLELKNWPYSESTEAALFYYQQRFRELSELASSLQDPARAYFLTYEDFLAHPSQHLQRLSRFLQMPEPLQSGYRQQKWTAKLSLGDVSSNIRRKQIMPNDRRDLVQLSPTDRQQMEDLFAKTTAHLHQSCAGHQQPSSPLRHRYSPRRLLDLMRRFSS